MYLSSRFFDFSILFGDFTGNGAVDLLCHRNSSGQITLFNFQSTQVLPLNREFCTNGKKIMSADLNGDSKLDLLCHQADGSIQYLLNYGLGGLFTRRFFFVIIQDIILHLER